MRRHEIKGKHIITIHYRFITLIIRVVLLISLYLPHQDATILSRSINVSSPAEVSLEK